MSNNEIYVFECLDTGLKHPQPFPLSDQPVKFLSQIFFLQTILLSLIQSFCLYVLKPLGETSTVAMMLGGVIIGIISQYPKYYTIMIPIQGLYQLETLGRFGCMIYLFLIGVKMDLSIIRRSSRKACIIGILTFIIPLVLTMSLAFMLMKQDVLHERIGKKLPLVALMTSSTSFHVINCFLADLHILNTDLGRLATSASTISGMFSWISQTITFGMKQYYKRQDQILVLYFIVSILAQVIFITFVLRKYVIWVIKQTPNGETVKDVHLSIIFLMMLAMGFISESLGASYFFGPIILGLAIPDGPPVGSALADKLDCLVSGLFLPVFCYHIGLRVNFVSLKMLWRSSRAIPTWLALFSVLALVGKLVATVIPCFFWEIPIKDAFMLGLILSTLGIFDLTTYSEALSKEVIPSHCFMVMVISALVIATIISPTVYWLYNPYKKYLVVKGRAIQNTKRNTELRILVCIYNQENVTTIINLLEASNPTKESPLGIFLLHLVELLGRSTPLLISHKRDDDRPTQSDLIIKSFRIYEKQNRGVVLVQPFTSITPFVTAHNDICAIAMEKKTSFIVIPFEKQWNRHGISQSSKYRNIHQMVLNKAPCSVGILIGRETINCLKSVRSLWSSYNVGAIFLGGADDREALFYAMRMAEHPNIHVTVHHIIPFAFMTNNSDEKILDNYFINEFKVSNMHSMRNHFRDEEVTDALGIIRVIKAMDNFYDLILVGRRHNTYSSLLSGLQEWNEYPELGFFGDIFASSDISGGTPVLIVQQHFSMTAEALSDNHNQTS